MRYFELAKKKLNFIVTPEELLDLLKDFHHVEISRGVPKNYTPYPFTSQKDCVLQYMQASKKMCYQEIFRRIFCKAFFSKRETCACEIPTSSEISVCVFPS